VREQGQAMLVLRDPGGEPLDRRIGPPMALEVFLRLAVALSVALGRLHRSGLVHKDIKPTNILVNASADRVWLTGFGIASRLPRERQSPAPPEFLEGTLAYMAPEQTGRMNSSIDSRSDLYSLGVTLYQVLTGSLPFKASDPIEWVHCHIAKNPMPPGERLKNVPAPVSAIIMKLLAKAAEDRYQTATGLEHDLVRCLGGVRSRIKSFPLGERDVRDGLLIPEKLYGREREISTLLASFDRSIKSGAPELVLVSGYSGIGKSSVVNELHKVIVPARGLFASGKFDQDKRNIPYATLAQAFLSLIRPLLAKSDPELAGWREAFRDALGSNGRLITDLVPELKLIVADQPPVPELPLRDAQRRFQLVFRRFLAVFAQPEHPLALFLDDLQWLDSATLDLLEDLLTQPDVRHLILIGAYRDNEVNSAHPLIRKLEAIRKAGAVVHEIILAPLTREDLGRLIGDALHCEPERVTALAELIHEKTAGNPFFANRLISVLVEEGLLTFDHGEGRWSWDLNLIRAKGYTDNVVDLLVGKLNRLPAETQQALQLLACMGNSAEFALLEMASQQSTEEMHGRLWEAIRAGLVFRSEHSFTFPHDRVQEAAYSLIPEEARAEAHLRIGRLLAARTPPEQQEEKIFDIVNQLNRGSHLISSAEEGKRFAELNLIAGRRAKSSTAYTSALSFLRTARALLTEEAWDEEYDLIFAIESNMAECELLTADKAAAENRLLMLAQRAKRAHDIARVTVLRVVLCTTSGQLDRGIEVALEYLRNGGTDWSMHPTREDVVREYDRIWSQLGSRKVNELLDLPLMTNPNVLCTMDVLNEIIIPAYSCDANLPPLIICRMVNLSLEHGNSEGSCVAYLGLAMIAGPLFGDYSSTALGFGQLGYDLVEQRGWKRFRARVYAVFGNIIIPWTRHVRAGRDFIRRAFDAANEMGDLTWAASRSLLVGNLLASGEQLADVQREAEDSLAFVTKLRYGLVIDIITAQLALIRTLRGLTPKFGCLDDGDRDEPRMEQQLSSNPALAMAACWYWIRKLQARYLAGDHAAAMDASSKAQRLLWTSPSRWETEEFCFYDALSHAASWDFAPPDLRQQHFEVLKSRHNQLDIWVQNCPENFENRVALVGAEIARIDGRVLDAEHLYEQAIRSAHENGFIHNEALAYELAARFYATRGFKQIADLYLRNARYGYLRWGADGKVRQLDEMYPDLRQEESLPGPTSTIGAPVEQLDLATVIKVSQAVSGEIALESLIDTLMHTAIEQAGAERALLIMPCGKEPRIKAEATTSGDAVTVCLVDEAVTERVLPESVLHYVLHSREMVILDDAAAHSPFGVDSYIRERQARSILCLPLLNQAKLIGLLYLENNLTPRAFAPTRISVLKLLASQAAIALENAHLYRDLAEREKQLTATAEVLRTISNAPSDIQSALNAVAEHAARLCDASNARIWRLEGDLLRLVASYGESAATLDGREGLPRNRETVTGRAACDRRTVHVHDIAAEDSEYPLGSRIVKGEGWHTTLATPLLREGTPIGTILVRRMEVRPFSDQEISLLETFADQAAIAIENVRLFEAEKQRTLALARANRDLAEREAKIRRLVDSNIIGIFITGLEGQVLEANDAFLRLVGHDRDDLVSGRIRWTDLTPPEWRERDKRALAELSSNTIAQPYEKEFFRKDGSRVPVLIGGALFEEGGNEGVAFVLDLTERKRAEEALREREAKIRRLVDSNIIGIFIWDFDGRVVEANDEFLRMVNYDREDLASGRIRWADLTPPDWRDRNNARIERQKSSGRFEPFEKEYTRKDGSRVPVLIGGATFEEGGDQGVAFVLDLTERKCAEQALMRSEAYLAQAQKLTHMGSWVWDPHTEKVLYCSEEMFRIFGLDPRASLPSRENFRQQIHPEDRDWVKKRFEESLRERVDAFAEYRVLLPDGTTRHINASGHPVINGNGELVEFIGTATDVTERKRAEQALRESEAKFRDYAETASDWLWETDPDHKFTLLTEKAFGSDPADRIGTTCSDYALDLETEPVKWRLFRATLDARKPFRDFVYCSVGGNGSQMYVKKSGNPVFDTNGEFVGYRGTATDVTAIVRGQRAEASLRTVQAELAHVSRVMTLGQLTASIAHEVNQPIGSARNNARAALNFLDRSPPDLGEVREALGCIVADADRAGGIIDRIRDQIKKAPPRCDRFDLNQAIEEVIGLAQSTITENGVSVQSRLASGMAPVQGDRVQLQQVVLNLILNAVEAMSSVGADGRELLISTEQSEANGTLVVVRDSGPGIDPKHLELVFEAFYSTKSGMGMGLSICRSIIAAHGGRLWAAASEPKGALFQFMLPNAEAKSSIARPFTTPESRKKTAF
jgi:PAS domain S-box-containing protein